MYILYIYIIYNFMYMCILFIARSLCFETFDFVCIYIYILHNRRNDHKTFCNDFKLKLHTLFQTLCLYVAFHVDQRLPVYVKSTFGYRVDNGNSISSIDCRNV